MESEVNYKFKASNFVVQQKGKMRDYYRICDLLGEGSFGEVRVCIHKESCVKRAVKVQSKSHMGEKEKQMLQNEICNINELDHPNILKMYEFFEDEKRYYLVTELCGGGELYQEISTKGKLTEDESRMVIKQVLSSIYYCHKKNIVHRDIKPENILLNDTKDFERIKLIDFGTSIKLQDEDEQKNFGYVGTPNYMAPEVVQDIPNYGSKCDIWSIGILTYVLLSGIFPIQGENEQEIKEKLRNYSEPDFENDKWKLVSKTAKDFIKKLLEKNPQKRLSAKDALQDPWILKAAETQIQNLNKDEVQKALNNLKKFDARQKFKQASIAFIASQLLTQEDKYQMDSIFRVIDTIGDGTLSISEIENAIKIYLKENPSDQQMKDIFKRLDTDQSKEIDYSEFLVSAMDEDVLLSEKNLQTAFNIFDLDGDHTISISEIKTLLSYGSNMNSDEAIQKIINEIDQDGDGEIDYKEFTDLLKSNKYEQESVDIKLNQEVQDSFASQRQMYSIN